LSSGVFIAVLVVVLAVVPVAIGVVLLPEHVEDRICGLVVEPVEDRGEPCGPLGNPAHVW
jgi:hypothetical protein